MWVLCRETGGHLVGPRPPCGEVTNPPPNCLCYWRGPVVPYQAANLSPALLPLPGHKAQSQAALETGGQSSSQGHQAESPSLFLLLPPPQIAVSRVQPPPCPQSSDAKGSRSPGARPCSRREKKTKQNRPGSKYYLNIKERDVSSYGSRISAF